MLKHLVSKYYESGCSFERWELAEQRTLEQKKNMRNVNWFEIKIKPIKPPAKIKQKIPLSQKLLS